MNSWWETPSCSEFLQKIHYEIRDGKIVLLFLPKHAPGNLVYELQKNVGRGHELVVERISFNTPAGNSSKPIETTLRRHFFEALIASFIPFSLKGTSTQPVNLFVRFHLDSPCLTSIR